MSALLTIHQVSARTGHSVDRIRHLRVSGHELYDQMWRNGNAKTSRLVIEEHLVDAWVKQQRARTRRAS